MLRIENIGPGHKKYDHSAKEDRGNEFTQCLVWDGAKVVAHVKGFRAKIQAREFVQWYIPDNSKGIAAESVPTVSKYSDLAIPYTL